MRPMSLLQGGRAGNATATGALLAQALVVLRHEGPAGIEWGRVVAFRVRRRRLIRDPRVAPRERNADHGNKADDNELVLLEVADFLKVR